MKSGGIWKHAAIALLLAVGVYAVSFYLIEGARRAKGPWLVDFQSDGSGVPSVAISQPSLKINSARFEFPGERIGQTNFFERVAFDRPRTNAPFGKVLFLDTTFQPGTVTLELFGHEIELLPRTLVLDKTEVPWKPEMSFRFPESNQ